MEQIGLGMYTLAEAARLIQAERPALQRWLYGYDYIDRSGKSPVRRHSEPLWQPQYPADEFNEKVVGFRDLLEMRVVRQFVKAGVPLLVVRHCMESAKQMFKADYPFTTERFATDGETIFMEAVQAGKAEPGMLNLRTRQYAFPEIIKASLYAGIEYSDGFARRWFPQPRNHTIVVDPAIQFGHPVVEESGVPTRSIFASYLAEGRDKSIVARLFEIPAKDVEAAVRFEEKLAAAA